jgi:hypothetical protein
MVTKFGIVKKTAASEYEKINKSGLKALNIREDDELITVIKTDGNKEKRKASFMENNAENISFNTHFFKIIGFAWLLIFIIGVVLLPYVSKQPTQYNEFIVNSTTVYNKANELRLFWFCTVFACVAVIATDVLLFRKGLARRTVANLPISKEAFGFFCIGIAPNIVLVLVSGSAKPILLWVAVLYMAASYLAKEYAFKSVLLLAYVYYAAISLIVGLNLINLNEIINSLNYGTVSQDWLLVVALLAALGIFAYIAKSQNYAKLNKLLLYLQFPIPLIFANNLVSRYVYQEQVFFLSFAPAYYAYYIAIIIAMSLWNIASYKRIKDNTAPKDADYIFPSTFVTIFAFNSYYYPAKFLQADFWHFGEKMLSWHQIVGHGSAAYREYIPPSGLYAMVDGFFQNVLLTGMVTDYSAAMNMSMTFFAIVVIVLCYYNSNAKTALLIAVCAGLSFYNRDHMILPIALTLMLPKLASNKSAWLQAWIVLSLLGFFYYPLYGTAVAAGMAPFAVLQFVCLVKDKNLLAKLLKKWQFYVSWLVVLGIIAFSAPLVFRILENMRIMSSQTLLADGINIMQSPNVPDRFFPYINISFVRPLVYYGVRFTLPAIAVTAIVYLVYVIICGNRKSLLNYDMAGTLAKLAMLPIMLSISYTFTLVRADYYSLLARTRAPIFAACIIVIVLFSVTKDALAGATQKLIICAAVSFLLLPSTMFTLLSFPEPILSSHQAGGFTDDTAKLKSAYIIPFDEHNGPALVPIDSATAKAVPLLGQGFGNKALIEGLLDISMTSAGIRSSGNATTGMNYLVYYAADLLVSGAPAPRVIRNKAGQLYLIQRYEIDRPFILYQSKHPTMSGALNSYYCYFIYRWIMDSDYVLLDGWYVPKEKAYLIDNGENPATSFADVQNETLMDWGIAPSELGNSLDSLKHLFAAGKEMEIEAGPNAVIDSEGFRIVFANTIAGRDYDALYLELEDKNRATGDRSLREKLIDYYARKETTNKTPVIVRWKTADGLTGEMSGMYGDGKLLFLLGAHSTWLLSENTEISIRLGESDAGADKKYIEEAYIKKVRLMSVLLD